MDLKKMNLVELGVQEKIVVNGGGRGFWVWLGEQIIEHWGDIREGWQDGGKGKPRY